MNEETKIVSLKEWLTETLKRNAPEHYQYSAERDHGGHIVKENFPFIERPDESDAIVSHMIKRQESNAVEPGTDKRLNPVIVVPASPGSGKSTFLVHFPHSEAYTKYCSDPVVSSLTFNSDMSTGSALFGLRIVYGLLRSMQVVSSTDELRNWDVFQSRFQNDVIANSADLSIKAIRGIFKQRRILLLVDELLRLNDQAVEKNVMDQIGVILDSHIFVDILVTSVSPHFVTTLNAGSGRPIVYVIPKLLQHQQLGKKESTAWARSVLDNTSCNDVFMGNLLTNSYILFSGHPRTLELINFALYSNWKHTMDEFFTIRLQVCSSQEFFYDFLNMLSAHIQDCQLDSVEEADIEKYVFTVPCECFVTDSKLRYLLEKGSMMIQRMRNSTFTPSCQLLAVLRWLHSKSSQSLENLQSDRLKKVVRLFNNMGEINLSKTWENMISATIACRSQVKCLLSETLGIKLETCNNMYIKAPWQLFYLSETQIALDGIYIPEASQTGFDTLVRVSRQHSDDTMYFYLQSKIQASPKKSLHKIVVDTIFNCLQDARQRNIPFDKCFVVLYMWRDQETIDQNDIESLMSESYEVSEFECDYISTLWKGNFHILWKMGIEEWLIPSFLGFPTLFE